MNDSFLLEIVLVGTIAALAATLFGIAALWAASGQTSWLWRLAPIVLLLAALAPIGAYELVAFYGPQAVVVIVVISLARFVHRWQAVRNTRNTAVDGLSQRLQGTRGVRVQFLLTDLLQAIILIAAVLAIVRNAAPGTEATVGTPIDWWSWVMAGVGFGAVTLAAAWAIFGHWRWYFRAIVFVLVVAGTGPMLKALGVDRGPAKNV